MNKILYKRSYSQRRNDLVVEFGEDAVNIAEIATSRFASPLSLRVISSSQFKSTCYAAKIALKQLDKKG